MANESTGLVAATASQDYTIYIVICLIILLVVGAFIIIRKMRKNKAPKEIPQDVIDDFNRAEQLAKQYKGTITPQEILWKINQERKNIYARKEDVPDYMKKDITDELQQLQPEPQEPEQPKPFKPKIDLNNLFKKRR